jgi:small-conductance mechanosensitive channel
MIGWIDRTPTGGKMFQEIKNAFGAAGDYILAGGLILASVIAGLILQFLILKFIRILSKSGGKASENIIVRHLRWPLRFAGPLLVIFALFEILRLPELPALFKIPEVMALPAQRVFVTLFILLFAWLGVKIISITVAYVEQRLKRVQAGSLRTRKIFTQMQIIKRIAAVVIAFIAVAVVLLQFKEISNLGTTILASAGVIGIILGFAAQRSIATLFAGFQIAFTQPIRLDDVVFVENEWGQIEEITLTYVVVRCFDQRRLILPITYFIEKPFQNWTRHAAEIIGNFTMCVDYTAPVAEIRATLQELAAANPLWDRRLCLLQVSDAREHSLELRIIISASDSMRLMELRCQMREALIRYLADRHPDCLPRLRASLTQENTSHP